MLRSAQVLKKSLPSACVERFMRSKQVLKGKTVPVTVERML